jgi:hypothetical protein
MKPEIIGTLDIEIQKNIFNFLIDINSKENPPEILEKIIELKLELGSTPLGLVRISDKQLAIADSSGNIYFILNK